jgi:hypothetical protein
MPSLGPHLDQFIRVHKVDINVIVAAFIKGTNNQTSVLLTTYLSLECCEVSRLLFKDRVGCAERSKMRVLRRKPHAIYGRAVSNDKIILSHSQVLLSLRLGKARQNAGPVSV